MGTDVGVIRELWRYPVKSMRGERISRAEVLHTFGIPGDRAWAVRDEASGEIQGAKKIGGLLTLAARYLEEPVGDGAPTVEIELPDGERVRTDDPGIDDALSDALGRSVTLWARQPTDAHDHYRRAGVLDETEIRRQLALLPSEPLPDYAARVPPEKLAELTTYVAPLGTYFDGYELHLLSTAAVSSFARCVPDSAIDVRRFRPNVVLDTGDAPGYPEFDWVGRHLRIGAVVIRVALPMSRCVMTTLPQGDLPRDSSIMRALVRETGMDLGVAIDVVEPGRIEIGDRVEIVD